MSNKRIFLTSVGINPSNNYQFCNIKNLQLMQMTNRKVVPGLENLIDRYFPVLDNGFLAVKDYMGSDEVIETAARTSYGHGTRKRTETRGLIRYLMRNRHTSPTEMGEIVLHVGMPIFVARQWVRHRTASLNEYSGRYSVMPMMFYSPDREHFTTQNKNNKQGRDDNLLSDDRFDHHTWEANHTRDVAMNHYRDMLADDVAKELARIDLPLSMYTYWYWKMDLHNLLHFLSLRAHSHAQYEIRAYANVIMGIVKEWSPLTFEAFMDYRMNGASFGRQERQLLDHMIFHCTFDDIDEIVQYIESDNNPHGLGKREVGEFINKLTLNFMEEEDFQLDISTSQDAEYYESLIAKHAIEV